MIICFRWKDLELVCFWNFIIPLFESEANLFLLVCRLRIKGAEAKYPFRKEYKFSNCSLKTCSGLVEVFQQILKIRVGIYLSKFLRLYPARKHESCNDHNSRMSSTRNTNDSLEPQGLQSYNTNLSWQWGQTDQTKCGVNLHFSAIYLKLIAKYFSAWQFLMSSRQCISNKLLSLQKCQFFFRHTQFLEFCLSFFLILLIVYYYCLLSCLKQR